MKSGLRNLNRLFRFFQKSPPPPPCTPDDLTFKMAKMGFVETEIPQSLEANSKANHSPYTYQIEKTDCLVIREIAEYSKPPVDCQIGEQRYIGVDRGEFFGGGLYLNEQKMENLVLGGNVLALVPLNQDLYILTGLAHMGSNYGAIHVIRNCRTHFKPERLTLLPAAPEAVYVNNFSPMSREELDIFPDLQNENLAEFVIVGSNNLMAFHTDSRLEVIQHNTFWGSLYPNSIVEDASFYFIGMRGGIVCISTEWHSNTFSRYFVPLIPGELLKLSESQPDKN